MKKEIEIYPTRWILLLRKYFLFLIKLYILVIIGTILGIYKYIFDYFKMSPFIVIFFVYTSYLIYAYSNSYRTPILINENHILPSENKVKVSLLGKRRINFIEIEKINDIQKEKDYWEFTIYMKNGKKIKLYVDELKDVELIKNTYQKFIEKK